MLARTFVTLALVWLGVSGCNKPASSPPRAPAPSTSEAASSSGAASSPGAEKREAALPVLLRIENASAAPFEDAFVNTTMLRTFGAVPAGARSEYQPFDSMSEAPHVGVRRDGGYVERPAREAPVETLKIGRYTLRLDVVEGEVTSSLTREDDVPSREELTAAFRAADEHMTSSLARAYAFLRRADTIRCGEDNGVSGEATLAFFVAPSGRTGGVNVMSAQHQGTAVERCLLGAVKRWRLPRYTGAMPPPLVLDVPLAAR